MSAPRPTSESPPDADPEAVARAICLRLLTSAPRTRAQLAEALAKRAVPGEVADRVLDRLTEVRLVDDAAFADAWVTSRHAGRGLARRALGDELRRRGVDGGVIERALGSLDADQERRTARALVERRVGATAALEPHKRVARLAGFLCRKGYAPGVALSVVRDVLAAEGVDAP
ncbi:MAG: recombination regulator RecX, partial [Actinomycetota bacterium]|nr:recombination regulator RecX [Actinomycetota bacterium]